MAIRRGRSVELQVLQVKTMDRLSDVDVWFELYGMSLSRFQIREIEIAA